jgi:hypothetical protein
LLTKEENTAPVRLGLIKFAKRFSKRMLGKTFPCVALKNGPSIVPMYTLTTLNVAPKDKVAFLHYLDQFQFNIQKVRPKPEVLLIDTVLPRGWNHINYKQAELIIDRDGNPRFKIDKKTREPAFYTALDYTISLNIKPKDSPLKKQWTPSWLRITIYRGAEIIDNIDVHIPLEERALYLLDNETFSDHVEKVAYRVFNEHFPDHENYEEYW